MPTQLPRVQVLLQPEDYAKVRQLAKLDRRSASFTCAALINELLSTEKYKAVVQHAEELEGKFPVQRDTRTVITQPHTVVNPEPNKWWIPA